MKCPYCEGELEKGSISIRESLRVSGVENIKFTPYNKDIKKKTNDYYEGSEGWYCPDCNRIIAVYKAK